MTRVTFTREAPSHHEDGPSYSVEADGEFQGEIKAETDRDLLTDRYVIFAYIVDLLDHPPMAFSVLRLYRNWDRGGVERSGEYKTARKALAAAKAHARKLLGDG